MNDFEDILYFYNNAIEIRYNAGLHSYTRITPEGQRILIPGATTVLDVINKPALVQWAANATVQWILQNCNLLDEAKVELASVYDLVKAKAVPPENHNLVYHNYNQFAELLNSARFNYRKISETALDIGTIAHNWLEAFVKGIIAGELTLDSNEPLPENPKAANCITAALAWMRKHQFCPIATERKIYSLEFDYSGTYDWTAQISSCEDPSCCAFSGVARAIGDYKSSKAIYEEYVSQLSSYWRATEEEFPGQPIDIGVVLRLGKEDGEFEVRTVTRPEAEAAFEAFLGALAIYNWKRQIELDERDAKAAVRAEKKAAKALEPKKPRAPRKVKLKTVGLIPVEGSAEAA